MINELAGPSERHAVKTTGISHHPGHDLSALATIIVTNCHR